MDHPGSAGVLRRRAFVALLGAAALRPRFALGQRSERTPRVGVLMSGLASDPAARASLAAFAQALAASGWRDGQNLRLDYRWAADAEQFGRQAAQLIASKPELIVAFTSTALVAVAREHAAVPVVVVGVADPVEQGFAASLAHPGGAMTGIVSYQFSIGSKWLGLLGTLEPSLARIAVLMNPEMSPEAGFFTRSVKAGAASLAMDVVAAPVGDAAGVEPAFAKLAAQPQGGMIVPDSAFLQRNRARIVELASRYRLPAIYASRDFVAAGGLMSYGVAAQNSFAAAASYVDRILKGAAPGELAIQGPGKFRLAINRKAANGLGLAIPPALLAHADEVIE